MKKVKIITITLIIAIITMIAFIGVYMPVQNRMENKVKDYSYAMDLAGTRNLRLVVNEENNIIIKDKDGKIVEDDTITDEQMAEKGYVKEEVPNNPKEALHINNYKQSKKILEKRLNALGVDDYIIKLDEANGDILVEIANNARTDYIVSNLATTGSFQMVDSQTGELLMSNEDIKTVKTLYGTTEATQKQGTTVYLDIEFNKEGTKKLAEISESYKKVDEPAKNTEETEEQKTEENKVEQKKVTLKIDGQDIMTTDFEEKIQDGKIQLTVGRATTDMKVFQENIDRANNMAVVLKEGRMPVVYEVAENEYVLSDITSNEIAIVIYALLAITVVALIVLIIRYKANGALGVISYIGLISTLLLTIRYTNVLVSIETIFGIVVIGILNYVFINNLLAKLKAKDEKEKIVIKESYKEYFIKMIPICITVIAFCFVSLVPISSFGMTMFWGITIIALYNIIITNSLLKIKAEK